MRVDVESVRSGARVPLTGARLDQDFERRRRFQMEEHEREMLRHDRSDRAQTRTLRQSFAGTIKKTMIWTLVATVAIMASYITNCFIEDRVIQTNVLIAWFTSTVVQVIGLMYIVANYLFPKSENGNAKP